MTDVTVTQEDRDAAMAFFRRDDVPLSVKMTLGYAPAPLYEAFAKHRQSSTEEVERAIIWHLLRDGRDVLRSEFLEAEG